MTAAILISLLLLTLALCLWQNRHIAVTQIEYESPLVPEALEGYTIAHVADLHNRPLCGGAGAAGGHPARAEPRYDRSHGRPHRPA